MEHQIILSKLERRLRVKLGCITSCNEEFRNKGEHGEVDLYGFDFRHRILYTIEIKRTDNPKNSTKAYKQLNKDEAYLRRLFFDFEPFKIIRFYAHSNKYKRQRYEVTRF